MLPHTEAAESQQRLSRLQESHLVAWIGAQAELGLPPIHRQLRHFATQILAAAGDHQPLGKHWVESFLARNSGVTTRRGRALDYKRMRGATTANYTKSSSYHSQRLPEDPYNFSSGSTAFIECSLTRFSRPGKSSLCCEDSPCL